MSSSHPHSEKIAAVLKGYVYCDDPPEGERVRSTDILIEAGVTPSSAEDALRLVSCIQDTLEEMTADVQALQDGEGFYWPLRRRQ